MLLVRPNRSAEHDQQIRLARVQRREIVQARFEVANLEVLCEKHVFKHPKIFKRNVSDSNRCLHVAVVYRRCKPPAQASLRDFNSVAQNRVRWRNAGQWVSFRVRRDPDPARLRVIGAMFEKRTFEELISCVLVSVR
jgi:hypothetical protein